MVFLMSCLTGASGAAIGSTYRIPVPGFPDIIVTTFLSPRPANTTTFNEDISLAAAPISISGAVCNTTCSGTAGTGPNQFDCTTIANSLRSNGATTVTLSPFLVTQFAFRSCKIFVSNQNATETIVSTQQSIAVVAQSVASSCNAAHAAAGGKCVYPVKAEVDVEHS